MPASAVAPDALPALFRSLADPTRLRILSALQRAELSVGELAELLGLAQSGVSRHLAVLRAAGLVDERREGTSSLHRVLDLRAGGAAALWPALRPFLEKLPDAHADHARIEALVRRRSRSDDYFETVAPHWDSLRQAQYGEDLRNLALLELVPRDLVVLDVGTGTGFMLLGLAPHAARVIGVDRSRAMLDKARENLAAAGVRSPDLREGTMEDLPVEEASVDVVLANMSLHHAGDPRKAVAEMARVLRAGGRVVLTDLARHDLAWTRDELADVWPGFEASELLAFLRAGRLSDARVRTIGTCTLTRAGRDRHSVDVLLASATKGERHTHDRRAPARGRAKRQSRTKVKT